MPPRLPTLRGVPSPSPLRVAAADLSNLGTTLDEANPGASELLTKEGVSDLNVVGRALVNYLHNPISIPFRINWCAARSRPERPPRVPR